jgi:ketosteroid isomerase-like protein
MKSVALRKQIKKMVDLETEAWDTRNADLLVSLFHPDMVWCWPPDSHTHNPVDWVFVMGRYNRNRWKKLWQELFDTYDLIHNNRKTVRIKITPEKDGAFAVVDVDTLWEHKKSGHKFHWEGRACKVYTKMKNGKWKLITHTGLLNYGRKCK